MNFLEDVQSKPNTIQGKPNYLKKYINSTGNNYNTNCLDIVLKKNSLAKYIKKIGDYNSVQVTVNNPPKTTSSTNYNQYCPAGWTQKGDGCYAPDSYNGPCNSGRQSCGIFNYNSSGQWCTSTPSYFQGYSADDKRAWAQYCGADWPTVQTSIACEYGSSILNTLVNLGNASSPTDAARMAIMKGYQYFGIINNQVYGASKEKLTANGEHNATCSENNQKMAVYQIDSSLLDLLAKCRAVNENLNSTNQNRQQLQTNALQLYDSTVKDKINRNPNWEKENKTNVYSSSTDKVQSNLNEIVKNLADNYNKKTKLYNLQADIINRNDTLVENTNKKLNDQLDTLDDLQQQIAVKERLAELNTEIAKKQERNKKLLYGFFVLLPFLVIPALLVIFNVTNPLIGMGLAGLMILGYIIYAIVMVNRYKIKEFFKPAMKKITKYERAIKKYYDKEKAIVSKDLSEFVYGQCNCPPEEQEETAPIGPHPRGKFQMNANGPFYYYDGSAPPQQIYPEAQGSIKFTIGDKQYMWPKEISEKLATIKDPIAKIFFTLWLEILEQKGISVDDPRFSKQLDVVDFGVSGQTPPPFWENIKLPMVTNLQQNISRVCQAYNSTRKQIGQDAATFLTDMWNYVYGTTIPDTIYQEWITKVNSAISSKQNVETVYGEYFTAITTMPQFTEKYGTMDRFLEVKVLQFVKVMNSGVALSEPTAQKILYQ